MKKKEQGARDELIELVKQSVRDFIGWLKPATEDPLFFKISKTLLKLPVALFMILVSPVLLLIVTIIFIILI